MSNIKEQIRFEFSAQLALAFAELLERKHLYQSVEVDLEPIRERISKMFPGEVSTSLPRVVRADKNDKEGCESLLSFFSRGPWTIVDPEQWARLHEDTKRVGSGSRFEWPAIKLPKFIRACPQCDNATSPYKPGCEKGNPRALIQETSGKNFKGKVTQYWILTYQCQACDNEPLFLMVRREGIRLSLVGRSLFEAVDIPKSIPESVRKYYRECIIAKVAGKGLPAALFLRILIERHMRSATGVEDRLRGDELAEKYSKTLDPEFPSSARSFRETYDNLSAILHLGEEDAGVLDASLEFVRRHFELLKSIPSPKVGPNSGPVEESEAIEEEPSIYPS